MKKETAAEVICRIETCLNQLSEIVQIAHSECSEDESKVLRRGVGYVLSEIQDRISDPIYRTYPELLPKGVDYSPSEGPTVADLAAKTRGSA